MSRAQLKSPLHLLSSLYGHSRALAEKDFNSSLIDLLPVAVFCKDPQNDFRYSIWNKECERIFGVPKALAIGKNDFEIFSAEKASIFRQRDIHLAQTGEASHHPDERVQFGAHVAWVRTWKTLINPGTHSVLGAGSVILCISQDISENLKKDLEAKEMQMRIEAVSANAPVVMYQFMRSPHGVYSFPYVSRRSQEIFGISEQEVMRDSSRVLGAIHAEDRPGFDLALECSETNILPFRWEGRIVHGSGKIKWIKSASDPRKLADGSILWDGVIIDITVRKESENLIRQQESLLFSSSRLVALGEMAGAVAHEINTPLSSILMCGERIHHMATSQDPREFKVAEISEFAKILIDTTGTIAKIVSGLRNFARDGKNDNLAVTDLGSVVEGAINLCGERMKFNSVKLTVEYPVNRALANCRAVEIGQVILNLVNNSFDAVTGTENPWIKIKFKSTDKDVEIYVIDSGTGVAKGLENKIFEPFFTTKGPGKGTGLGLSISLGILEKHGGALFVDGTAANTTFVVKLPKIANRVNAA